MANLMFVENHEGRQFAVKVLVKGDTYGRNRCVIWDEERPGIEFYDVTYAGEDGFDEIGQFVSRYYLETFIEHGANELHLWDDIPQWTITTNNVFKIRTWIKQQVISGKEKWDIKF